MVTVKVDSRKRVVLPDAKPGQVLAYSNNGKGQIVLLELKPASKQEKPASILDGLKPLTKEECEECWGPNSDPEWDRIAEAMSKVPVTPPEDD